MPKVSIIIPIYNAEEKLDRTMESVLRQTLRDIEVLLIDDGSQDRTVEIARAWEEKDDRVRLIVNEHNMGVSKTRNVGLDNAAGEFIRFVDGDDTIPEASTYNMVKIAEKENADIVIGIMRRQSAVSAYNFGRTVKLARQKKISKYDENLIHSFSVCNKMFRRSLLEENGLRFRPFKHAEDGLFLYECLQCTDRINGYGKIAYVYDKPEFFEAPSTTQNLTKEMLDGILDISERIRSLDPDAPQEFVDNFNARILGITLINEYYRKIWRLDPDVVPVLLEKIREYWAILPDKQRNDVIRMNRDLPVAMGLGDRAEVAAQAVFTIVIGPGVSPSHLPVLLESLYYQRMPLFVVVIHPSLADAVPAHLRDAENLTVAEDTEDFYDRQADTCTGSYISFIDEDVTFTFDTLSVAYNRLQKNVEVVGGNIILFDGKEISYSDTYEYAYAEYAAGRTNEYPAHDELDGLLSNKFIKVSAIRRAGIIFGDDPKSALPELYRYCTHGRYRGIRYAASIDVDALWDRIEQPAVPERLEKYKVEATTGKEKKTDIIPFLKDTLRHRVNRKALFVGREGVLHGAMKEIYDRFDGPKAKASAEVDGMPAVKRSLFYRRHRIVFMEGMDGFLKTKVLHGGEKCYPMINRLVHGDTEIEEAAAYLQQVAREERARPVHSLGYAKNKVSQYLIDNKKVRKALFLTLNRTFSRVVPLGKNKVLFVSDGREQLGGNMQYVHDQLPDRMRPYFDFTGNKWTFHRMRDYIKLIYRISTCKYIILEDFYRLMENMKVRKGQEICQLWHAAGAYKKFAHSRAEGAEAIKIHSGYEKYTKAIVSAPAIRGDYAEAFHISADRVQATGIPRTDIFFDEDAVEKTKASIYEEYPAFKEKKVILFAPTYRGRTLAEADYDFSKIDPDVLYEQLKDDYVFIFKWHPATYETLREGNLSTFQDEKYHGFFYDLSDQRDINDLLLVTDIMITDYSSVIFDYLLVDKPIIYYAYDLEEYSGGRGLYYAFEEYLYGPVVRDIDSLIEAIRKADPCEELREAFRNKFMSACDGHATEKTVDYIFRNKLPASAAGSENVVMQRAKATGKLPAAPVEVHAVRDRGEKISVEGIVYSTPEKKIIPALESESNQRYETAVKPYPKADVYGDDGGLLMEAESFRADLPKRLSEAYFFVDTGNGLPQRTEVAFLNTSGLAAKNAPKKVLGSHTVSRSGQKLVVREGADTAAAIPEMKEVRSLLLHGHPRAARKKLRERERLLALGSGEHLSDTTALITIRGEKLEDNLSLLQKELTVPVTTFAHRRPFDDRTTTDLYKKLFGSKVVVTDDYMWLYRTYPKPEGQKLVQVWHACGAFKKFGVDGTSMFPAVDALTHQYYDLVAVSSEAVRPIYAQAFDIDIEKVQALGSPRTDLLFDEAWKEEKRRRIYEQHPEWQGKQIILYAPTFRDLPGIPRSRFRPVLDFGRLSASLREDQIFLLCPHPVMTEQIVTQQYGNVKEVRDFSTMDMMLISDLLITDYSSVIFEYSLLGKPVAFYCYDYDDYDRDFYLDYETELPGELFKTEEALLAYLAEGQFPADERQTRFVETYMSACDGHSAERIARAIEALGGRQ
ncbi:MAG: bifunctional glycosyltransferase family 2 protein/CDP-glycerol:glycerophosphate glycerophosphotransferase [Clostridiales bacterium]|nr:bifunctional glycosyltransferase family 2 protein/CDP-glycerol:glycerophosphate glycerophosphotransferase [Clostridiales bacterium]